MAVDEAHISEGLVRRGDDGARAVLVVVALTRLPLVWAEFCASASAAALGEILKHAWEFFGLVPRTWRFDSRAALPPDVLELAQGYGATARPHAIHEAMVRGVAECALRRVPERLLRRQLLRDLDHANRLLRDFVEEWNRDRGGSSRIR